MSLVCILSVTSSTLGLKQSGDILAFATPALGGADFRVLAIEGIANLLGGLLIADFEMRNNG